MSFLYKHHLYQLEPSPKMITMRISWNCRLFRSHDLDFYCVAFRMAISNVAGDMLRSSHIPGQCGPICLISSMGYYCSTFRSHLI